jgi:NitT/TauT family transport system substrate-binding protein
VLDWALTRPMDRVMYTPLAPTRKDFELIVELMVEAGLLEHPIPFDDFVDTRFADAAMGLHAWDFEPGGQP